MKIAQKRYLLIYLLLAEVLEVGVVEVQEGVLGGSDQHGTILKQFFIQTCASKMSKDDICLDIYYLLRSLRFGLTRFMRVSWKAQTNMGPY